MPNKSSEDVQKLIPNPAKNILDMSKDLGFWEKVVAFLAFLVLLGFFDFPLNVKVLCC